LGPGSKFYQNQGVITASIKQDHVTLFALAKTFVGSFIRYFLKQPSLLLVFILTVLSCRRSLYKNILLIFFILPGFLLWFTLGSYDVRLGLYLLVSCGVLIMNDHDFMDKRLFRKLFSLSLAPRKVAFSIFAVGIVVFLFESFARQVNLHQFKSNHIYPFDGGLTNCYHFFDNQAEFIYSHIYNNKHILIFTVVRNISGIFYGHTPIAPSPTQFTEKAVLENFIKYKPDYVFASFCQRDFFDCKIIKEIAKNHPDLLISIPMKHAKWDHRLYKLNKKALISLL
jgi:hypothetical protein